MQTIASVLGSLLDVALIVLGFGMLIFVHELGHFLAAKWAGIRTEGFAIGMGPVVVSWRKGMGPVLGSTNRKVVALAGKPAHELSDRELAEHGLGETEYSLRWLPIGGFVKMLGQEDLKPTATSDDPRNYNACPISKRMVVVSAGVIMNVILAAVLFMLAFLIGVPFEDTVIGEVEPSMPAGRTVARNAETLGVSEPGLLPGDRVTHIDGDSTRRFADIMLAAAMGRPDVPIDLTVQRDGLAEPLEFSIRPEKNPATGLLGIGVAPAASPTLLEDDGQGFLEDVLDATGLAGAGVGPGWTMISADGRTLKTFEQFQEVVSASGGEPVHTRWTDRRVPGGPTAEATIDVRPVFDRFMYVQTMSGDLPNYEAGLFGLSPLVKITTVMDGPNAGLLESGDVVLRIDDVNGPRTAEFMETLSRRKGRTVELEVLRDGEPTVVDAVVDRKGKLRVGIGPAWDVPMIARPLVAVRPSFATSDRGKSAPTPVAELELFGRSRFEQVGDTPVSDWSELRAALRDRTAAAAAEGTGASVTLTITSPTRGRERETVTLDLTADEVLALHDLGWTTDLPVFAFEPVRTVISAGGNPLTAIVIGVKETHKAMLLTYLTFDRLFRGTVGVEQLRGPVGIVHLGTEIIDRGFMYVIYLLAIISVNLAVINFLPLPIVDGGLFLFLVYEKIKGHPPSLAFQNAATIVGVALIGTVLLVVTWNDVIRIFG